MNLAVYNTYKPTSTRLGDTHIPGMAMCSFMERLYGVECCLPTVGSYTFIYRYLPTWVHTPLWLLRGALVASSCRRGPARPRAKCSVLTRPFTAIGPPGVVIATKRLYDADWVAGCRSPAYRPSCSSRMWVRLRSCSFLRNSVALLISFYVVS